MRYDLVDLQLFVQIAATSSITRGADQCHMSLASASARIRGMEAALGVPLLHRGPRGVTPTPAGQTLLHHAQVMLQHHERMRGDLGNFARGLKGHIKLLSNTIAATEFLPKPLAHFLAAHPNIDIELEERNSAEIVNAIAEGYADAGILVELGDHGGLQAFPFQTDRLVLVASRGHPLGKRRSLRFQDVLDQEFVGLGAGRALQEFLGRQAARAGQALKVRVRMTSFDAICQMVELGAGIAIVPGIAARKYGRKAIDIVGLTDEWAVRKMLICCRRHGELSDHARRLVEQLRAA
jgi:DNA-binding transcriptional LysR family regulator